MLKYLNFYNCNFWFKKTFSWVHECKTLAFPKKVFFFFDLVVSFIKYSHIKTTWGPSI